METFLELHLITMRKFMGHETSILGLAYLGDCIYEFYIRRYLLSKGITKVKELQQAATLYVSAKAQATFLKKMMETNFLTQEELDIVKRARNHKGNRHPKHTDILTYKYATGLEAMIGYLYYQNQKRIEEIMEWIIGETECMYMEKM